jgi:hypothetical protein
MDLDQSGAPGNPLWEGLDKPDTQASTAPAAPMPEPRAPTGPKDDTSSLSEFLNSADPEQTSAGGTFARGVALGAAPAATGLAGAGAGAYIGGAVGLLGGPLAEFTVPAGAFVGGLAGGIGGGYAGSVTQNYAISQIPETAEKLGISERQQQLMANEHGNALFMGGLVPMALTMRPGGFARGAVPEGATTFQQLMASPVTARLMGGGIMGGVELGQELAGGQAPDWTKIGISTGFGIIFNKPNRIGEALIGAGERPVRAMLPGIGERTDAVMRPEAAPAPEPLPGAEPARPVPLAEVPPPAAGYVRFFHGGEEPHTGGGRWTTVDPVYARDFRSGGEPKPVWYVDVPVGHDVETGARAWDKLDEDFKTNAVGTYNHVEIPEEFAKQMKPYPMPPPAEPGTVIQAADTGVLGPGITEQTYMGNQARDPAAAQSAQDMARTEDLLLGRSVKTEADVQRIARQMEPELFQRYDEALQRYEGLKRWIADYNSPPPDVVSAAVAKVNTLQAQLEQHVTSQNGYSGGHEARRLRAHLRDAQRELQTIRDRGQAFAEGRAEPAPEREAARQHMLAADIEMRDMAAEVSAALRRAAEAGGSEVVPPKGEDALEAETPPAASVEPPIIPADEVAAEAAVAPRSTAEQHAAIVDDVKAKLIAAGRPDAEAQAHAEIIAAYYETRAARFKGALGTAEELYRKEAPAIRGGKGVVPGQSTPPAAEPAPRLPAVIRSLVEPPAAPAVEAPAPLVPTEEKPALPPSNPAVAGPGGGIEAIDPTTISVDAKRFQFKAGGDESGVTERLQGVEKWDPRLAGTALVFRDAEGKDWIADGHQRLALAKRLSEGQPGIRINAFVLKEGDGVTDAEARVIAAIKNIAEGTGTSIDAAKILREAGESGVEMPPLPPKSVLVREGRDLAKLSSDAFGMAVNGVVPTNQAAVVGRMVTDPAVQAEAMRVLAKSKPENMRQAEMVVRELLETGTEEGTQQSLFGDEHFASSIVLERAKIADEALRQLARDRTTFRTLVSEADRITSLGQNELDAEANKSRLTSDEQAQQLLTALAFRKGEISDALSDVSRQYKAGSISRAEASRQFLEAVRRKIESGLDEGPDLGRSLLGAEPEPAQELAQVTKPPAVEPGAEGLPQTLIPGVEPVTDRQRLELEASKPLQGGNAAPGGLFDEEARSQQELFQGAQGTIRLTPGKRSVITLMGTADASTFMHESGHQFLEDLLTDAGHDAAPSDIKADAATVRNWLGLDEGGQLKTAQHEKFARGFEQYLREGRAPSQALARVFSQFRDWLVSIYRTMKGLGAPITDDVRGVFDRMLALEPQSTVIAADHARQPSLADIHRTDATETEPHDAEPVMDRVISERERYIADQPPEIQREIQAVVAEVQAANKDAGNAGAEDGAGAVGRADVGAGGGQPQIEPEGGAGGAGHGDELGGGGPARAEGPSVSRIPDGADVNRPKPNPPGSVAPTASPRIGPDAPNPLADKAGNIRLDLLTDMQDLSAEKIRDVIRQAADQNEEFIGDRRGVVTDGMAMDLANDLGMEGAWRLVRNRVKGQAFNAEQIMVLSKLLVTSASSVSEASTKAASGAPGDILAYAIAKERHTMIQATVAAGTAEAGRALRAFQLLKKYNAGADAEGAEQAIRDATGRTLNQLRVEARLAAQLDTPQKVSKFLRDNQNRSLGRMVLEVWINGLISGVATHSTYSVGNTLTSILSAGPETAVAAGIGAVRQALGRGGERAFISEVPAKFKGAFEGLPSAVKASFGAMRTGVTTLLPGESLRNLPPGVKRALREHAANLNQPSMLPGGGTQPDTMPFQPGSELVQPDVMTPGVQYRDAVSGAMGVVQGIKDGIIAGAALVKAGGVSGEPLLATQYSPLGYVPDVNVHGVTVPIGSTIRLPGRFIAAIHSFFRSMNYSMEINALSTRVAIGEGLTGVARDARIASLRQSPPEEMMAAARGQATELTLMNHANEWMRKLGDLTNAAVNLPVLGETPVLKFVDPFVQIAANVTAQGPGKRSVLGLMSSEIRADLMGKNGNIAADRTLARMLVGTALSIGFGSLAAKKLINGSGPSDPKQSAMWRMAGNQPHSVRIGDTWYNVGRLGPLGMLMGISADMYDVAHTAEKGDMLTAAAHLQHAFTQNILDESFMRGPAELIQAVEDPGRYGENYLKNFVSSFVPFSVGMAQMARAADPYSRQARTVMDAIKNKVPGLSEELMPRRDIFGEPLPNLPSLGGRAISAIYESQVNNDPVVQAFNQLGIFPANVDKKIRGIELTPQQFDDFQRIGGRLMKQRLDALVASQAFQTLPPYVKHNVLKEYVTQSREAARGLLMAKYPQIAKDAYDLKIQTRTDFQENEDF